LSRSQGPGLAVTEVPLREHLERVMALQGEALNLATKVLEERLERLGRMENRVETLEAAYWRAVGFGAALVFASGIAGAFLGKLIK